MRPGRSCNPCGNCYGTGPDNGPRSSGFRPCGDSPDPVGVGIWSEINRPIPPKHREGPESYHRAGRAGGAPHSEPRRGPRRRPRPSNPLRLRPAGSPRRRPAAVLAVVSDAGPPRPGRRAPVDESDRLKPDEASFRFPTVPPEHGHVRALLENALRYVRPAAGLFDEVSGYPVEGWNRDPERQFSLRSFTQLTAIGHAMELLACLAAGEAEVPFLSRGEALTRLAKLVASLRQDQRDPKLGAGGLLVTSSTSTPAGARAP